MKKLMVYSTAILMLISFSLKAQDKNTMEMTSMHSIKKSETKAERKEVRKEDRNLVSELSMNAFIDDFGDIPNVAWEKGPSFDEALYTKDGIKYKAFYDESSKLVGTITDKTFADLPTTAQKEINKKYKDYKVDKVVFFRDNELNEQNMSLYGINFEDTDNYFAELSGEGKNIILKISPEGRIFFFKEMNKEI